MIKKNPVNIQFGARIAYLRNSMNITQEQLANICEINRTYIGEIERGEKSASIVMAAKITCGLKITLSELFDYEQ